MRKIFLLITLVLSLLTNHSNQNELELRFLELTDDKIVESKNPDEFYNDTTNQLRILRGPWPTWWVRSLTKLDNNN
jgi:hypothetical protein